MSGRPPLVGRESGALPCCAHDKHQLVHSAIVKVSIILIVIKQIMNVVLLKRKYAEVTEFSHNTAQVPSPYTFISVRKEGQLKGSPSTRKTIWWVCHNNSPDLLSHPGYLSF